MIKTLFHLEFIDVDLSKFQSYKYSNIDFTFGLGDKRRMPWDTRNTPRSEVTRWWRKWVSVSYYRQLIASVDLDVCRFQFFLLTHWSVYLCSDNIQPRARNLCAEELD